MTDTPQWPLNAQPEVAESEAQRQLNRFVFDEDPLAVPELPRLVFPAPLVDPALLDRDDDKEES